MVLPLVLASCAGTGINARVKVADQIANAAGMQARTIQDSPFILSSYERIEESGGSANLYIEGDGLAWLNKRQKSLDPTPKNPIALKLASQDPSPNVIYLARPCQYSKMRDGQPCDNAYWGIKRFAPEVIEAYKTALDDIKARYHLTGFHLIGYSGGAAIAALLTAERKDILSLRSVAGNLDHRAHSIYHGISVLTGSLNPPAFPDRLARIPQYHFVGAKDENVPRPILDSYINALSSQNCVRYSIVQNASHSDGWVEQWPILLRQSPACTKR